ncbi:unnamed protein product [Cuscuta campestris]|uniref:Uncharacterized protein n=1 Tax=Cuscuta campestris TaxID=132261 RepID=A0A484N8B9_9ASTE|nr:unnamed protein product [Cuscuta campestris]
MPCVDVNGRTVDLSWGRREQRVEWAGGVIQPISNVSKAVEVVEMTRSETSSEIVERIHPWIRASSWNHSSSAAEEGDEEPERKPCREEEVEFSEALSEEAILRGEGDVVAEEEGGLCCTAAAAEERRTAGGVLRWEKARREGGREHGGGFYEGLKHDGIHANHGSKYNPSVIERDTDSFKKRNHREQRGFEKQVASVATIPSSTTAKVVSHNGKGEQHKVSQAAPTNSASDAAVLQPQRCTRVRHSVTHQEINMATVFWVFTIIVFKFLWGRYYLKELERFKYVLYF